MNFRKAGMKDVEEIYLLVKHYADKELMLYRSRPQIQETLRDYTVAEKDGTIIATGALHILWGDLGEIRSLAVAPQAERQGLGRMIVDILLDEARNLGISRVMALTYQQGFFEKCGFQVVEKETLPQKVWRECIDCPKFPHCDEVAVLRSI
ncbi:MAG: N-acetyltransferase [Bacillota bacterium]